jgi:hypothetical protein
METARAICRQIDGWIQRQTEARIITALKEVEAGGTTGSISPFQENETEK